MLQYIFQLTNSSDSFNSNDISLLLSPHFNIKNINFNTDNNKLIITAKKLDPDFTLTLLNSAGYEAVFSEKIPLFFSRGEIFSAILSIAAFIIYLLLYFTNSQDILPLFTAQTFVPYTAAVFSIIIILLNYRYYSRTIIALLKKKMPADLPITLSTASLLLFSCYQLFIHSYDNVHFMPLITILVLSTIIRLIADTVKKEFFRVSDYSVNNLPATVCRLDLDSDEEKNIPLESLQKDDIVIIKAGDILPTDGEISWGDAQIDESIITGDSTPSKKSTNDLVYAQTKNIKGCFQYRVTAARQNTLLYQLRQLSYSALIHSSIASPSINKLSSMLLILSILASFATAFYWFFTGQTISFIITTFASTAIILSPYNLTLAKNLLLHTVIIKSARHGIFIKNIASLNNFYHIDTLILGKSGIITTGKSKVIALHPEGLMPKNLLALAASAEYGDNHHLAAAIMNSAIKNKVHTQRVSSSQSIDGNGVEALINREIIRVGKAAWLEAEGVIISSELKDKAYQAARKGHSPLFISIDKYCHGVFIIEDPLRNELAYELHSLNKINTILFTGDDKHVAKTLAQKLEINQFHAEMTPTDKAKEIALLHTQGLTIAFVSSKPSDIYSFKAADIGILFNNPHPDTIAIDAADIICMNNKFSSITSIISFARTSIKKIKQNIALALFCNIIGGIIAAGGIYHWTGLTLSPIIAICIFVIISLLIMSRTIFTTLIFNK